jgi:D-alanyl-D-alanine carboxypeptidase
MHVRVGRVLVALVFLASACSADDGRERGAAEGVPSAGDPELAVAAAKAVASHGAPALGVAHVSLEDGARVGIAGSRSHEDEAPVAIDARFHLGSDTKAMTAILVAQLVEEERLDLDAPISDVLTDAAVDASYDPVTVRDVLGHRAGLADALDLRRLHEASDVVAARREAVDAALGVPSRGRGSYAYANVGYMLAGVLVDQLSGQPWEEVIRERLFAPLGMTTCGLGAPMGRRDPLGHDSNGRPIEQDAAITDNPPAMGPAGTVHCSMGDWARFVTAILELLNGTDTAVLSAATAADLFADEGPSVAGWLRSDMAGTPVYSHDGSNTLWYARATLRPADGTAVLVATNTGEAGGVRAIDELTRLLLR